MMEDYEVADLEQRNYEAKLEDDYYRRQDGSTSMIQPSRRRTKREVEDNPELDEAVYKALTEQVVEEAKNEQ